MAKDNHWMEKAFKNAHGQLHKAAGVPKDKKIPYDELNRLVNSANPTTRKRAQAAMNARKANGIR